jgi:glutamyl-tRNA synthetase
MEPKLAFPQDSPPLAILCAAKVAGVSLTLDPKLASGSAPTLHLGSG